MKKILAVIACLGILLAGCGAGYTTKQEETFYTTIYDGPAYEIVYDNHTHVMYHFSTGAYNCGNLTPLYNADGTLRVWEE